MSRSGYSVCMDVDEEEYNRFCQMQAAEEAARLAEEQIPNIVLFGTTGAGKSSVINMLKCPPGEEHKAEVKSTAKGVTATSRAYTKLINEKIYTVFDSAGMHEGARGTVPMEAAIAQFHELLVRQKRGIHLVVLVMQGQRITTAEENNYHLIKYLCGNEVPLVLVFTRLENEDDVAGWWTRAEQQRSHRIFPDIKGHACITTIRGKKPREPFRQAYEESVGRVESLLAQHALAGPNGHIIREHSAGRLKKLTAHVRQLREEKLTSTDFHEKLARFLRSAYDLGIGSAVTLALKVAPTNYVITTM